MPVATVDPEDTFTYELKSLPEGRITLRRLPYGAWLKRQEMAMQMKVKGMERGQETEGELAMANRKVTEFEFRSCIVDHNLTNADESPLDFRQSFTLDILNPKVGNEIGRLINALHDFEEDLGNSPQGSEPRSSDAAQLTLT